MRLKPWRSGIAVVALACASSGFMTTPAPAVKRPPLRIDGSHALLHVLPHSIPRAHGPSTAPVALPSWHGSFTQNGTTYGYTMLGTDPAAGSQTTRLRINLLPLQLTFDDGGVTLDPTDRVQDILESPIFRRSQYLSGTTQYADAMQRSSFWDDVQSHSRGYHVLLEKPTVLPTASLTVPALAGHGFQTATGPAGAVTTAFLFTLLPLLSNYYDPGAGLIIVVKDVTGEDFLGFHFTATPAGQTLPQTFIWTGYFTPGVVVSPQKADAYVLSHEVAEWINDPYLTNVVPVWNAPGGPACFNNLLETGDPVEFLPHPSFEVAVKGQTYHVTDTAGISWFAHDVPSRQLGGAYSYAGNLTSFSSTC